MEKGITIIIPNYNCSKYIEKCLNSIVNQNIKKYEIIIVDDCSIDNSIEVIENYIKSNSNSIKLLKNDSNRGAGYSRNKAIKEASYDILSFIDADDYVEDNYYEELLNTMIEEKSDVVVCDIYIRYEKGFGNQDFRNPAVEHDKQKINFINNGLSASPCNKLIKKDLLIKYPFAEDIMNEDVASILAILIKSNKISYNKNTYYNYIQRNESVQNEKLNLKRLDIFKSLDILKGRIAGEKKYNEYINAIIYQQVIMLFIYVIPKEKSLFNRYKFLKQFDKLSKQYNIRKNNLLWNFLETQGRKHKLYYRLIFKLNSMKLSFMSSLLISIYNNLKKFKNSKTVIKKNVTLFDIISSAKKNKKLKNNNKSLSVVVPNYNYEKFIYERIYSILYQDIKIDELIILDDFSKDNSRKIIDELVDKIEPYINVKKVYNDENSGSAFKQWHKGFQLSTCDYVWIAEADDYSDKKFLRNVMKSIYKDDNIVISYADTAFINKNGSIIMKTIKPEIDIQKTGHWNKTYINDGISEIKNYAYLNCTIANVSSVIFKNDNYENYFKISGDFKQAGDWLFYVNVMKNGKICYNNKALNYYRLHGDNVTSTTKKKSHLDEIKRVHEFINKDFRFNKKQNKEILKRYKFLVKVWDIDSKNI